MLSCDHIECDRRVHIGLQRTHVHDEFSSLTICDLFFDRCRCRCALQSWHECGAWGGTLLWTGYGNTCLSSTCISLFFSIFYRSCNLYPPTTLHTFILNMSAKLNSLYSAGHTFTIDETCNLDKDGDGIDDTPLHKKYTSSFLLWSSVVWSTRIPASSFPLFFFDVPDVTWLSWVHRW